MNESKIDNYIERMPQSLISDSVKEDFRKFIYDHAINYCIKGKVMIRKKFEKI